MKRLIGIFVVLVVVSSLGGVVTAQEATNQTASNATATATPTPESDSLSKADVLRTIRESPHSVPDGRVTAIEEWLVSGGLDTLNSVESEDVASWLQKAEQGAAPVSPDNRTYIGKVSETSRVFDYQFRPNQGTLTVWVEADVSESFYMWDSSVFACAEKGASLIPDGAEKSGTLSRGDNKLTILVERCDERYQAGLRIGGETMLFTSADKGSPIIPGPFNSFETQLVGAVGVLIGVSTVAFVVVRRRRTETLEVERV